MKYAITVFLALFLVSAAAQAPCEVDDRIQRVLIDHCIPPFTIRLIISQARLESGNYTNRLFKDHQNPWGMMHPSVRPTRSKGRHGHAEGRGGYASFNSIEDATEDYILYQRYMGVRLDFKTTKEFVRTLKRNLYFGSSEVDYLRGILLCNKLQKSTLTSR